MGKGIGVEPLSPIPYSPDSYALPDRWIIARLRGLVRDVERLFQAYQYGEAGRQIYEFFWSEFADWYVEAAKIQMAAPGKSAPNSATAGATLRTLVTVLDTCLRLLHPFTPFLTEELWGHLKKTVSQSPLADLAEDWPEALIIAPWPMPQPEQDWEAGAIAEFTMLQEIVRSIRNVRAEKNVTPGRRIPAMIVAGDRTGILRQQVNVLAALAQLDTHELKISEDTSADRQQGNIVLVVGAIEVYLPLSGLVDLAGERARLQKELEEASAQIERLEKLLSSPFAGKAPPQVVQKEREKLAGYQETAAKLQAQIEALPE